MHKERWKADFVGDDKKFYGYRIGPEGRKGFYAEVLGKQTELANRIVADHNALSGLDPEAVIKAVEAFEAITVAARLEKLSLLGPAWRDLLAACEEALRALKEGT